MARWRCLSSFLLLLRCGAFVHRSAPMKLYVRLLWRRGDCRETGAEEVEGGRERPEAPILQRSYEQTELAVASSLVCWPRLHAHYEFHGRSTVVLLFQRTEICLLGTKMTTFANISVTPLMPCRSMTHRLHYYTITFIYLFSHIQTTDEAMYEAVFT